MDFVKLRREICNDCDKIKVLIGVKVCSECGCSIWGKTMIPNAECPIGKWKKKDDKTN